MVINDVIFNCDLDDILQELRTQLHTNRIPLLEKEPKRSGNSLQIQCPYHGNGQEKNRSAGIRKSDGMFHCFKAGTKVLTFEYGSIEIEKLCGNPVHVLNGEGNWESVTFGKYGKSSLMKITLTQDNQQKEIYATPNHEWYVHGKAECVLTQNLKPNVQLESLISNIEPYNFCTAGLIHGIIYGDGTRNKHYKHYRVNGSIIEDKNNVTKCSYTIHIPKFTKKRNLIKYFNSKDWSITDCVIQEKPYYRVRSHRFPLEHNYKVPPSLHESIDYLISFLAGYFACDGSFELNNISSTKYEELNLIRNICIHCGIAVRDIKKVERTKNTFLQDKLSTLYILPVLRQSLDSKFFILEDNIPIRKYCRSRWRVKSVEWTEFCEDVYCCETSTHSFVLDGNILTHNCFACGEIHTLPEFITFTFGHTDDVLGKFGWKWLLKNFATISVEERKDVDLDIDRSNRSTVDTKNYVTEEELDTYRYYHPYWDKRGITDKELIELFDLGFDEKTNCITFPVKDINGNCLFVARRSVKYKYFNYPEGTEKPLYGLWELYQLEQFPQEIIVCESMLDALTCWQYGSYGVALNGTGDPQQFKALRNLPCRELIVATDNDNAGNKAFERIKQSVTNKLIYRYEIPRIQRDNGKVTKDINDLTKEEYKNLQKHL